MASIAQVLATLGPSLEDSTTGAPVAWKIGGRKARLAHGKAKGWRRRVVGVAVVVVWLFGGGPGVVGLGSAGPGSPATPTTGSAAGLRIVYPIDEAVFPPEIASPTFRWEEQPSHCDRWRVTVRFPDGSPPLIVRRDEPHWRPDAPAWEAMKQRSVADGALLVVEGFRGAVGDEPSVRAQVSFSTSPDEVGAPIFYRDVNLPFLEAVKDPSLIRWRFGAVSSTSMPPAVLERVPVCGNCHSFSRDGGVLGMDVDYANSKASYAIVPTAPEMALRPRDVITWNDFRKEDGEQTFGLLSQVSPDGRWVVSTVKDKSVFVPMPDLAFSQLFFPVKGILAVYDREARAFAPLPGADDPAYVQSNPAWSPDGSYLVFARSQAYDLSSTVGQGRVLLTREECREFTEDRKPFRFDLYRIPFNGGRGGEAEPLAGASGDGRSNFFPKVSPDGRWIVFCKASSYMLLQPDSELYIVPAEGGEARRLRANLPRMNSWHSWSPNGRWLVFSSKGFSDYTQLWLTHIDGQGNSSPPVWLDQFTAANRAANIPEFVNPAAGGITRIQAQFLDDYSFERAANEFYRSGDPDQAIANYRKALELNPDNATAHQRLGFLLYHVKRQRAEGLRHTEEAFRLDPASGYARSDLGVALLAQNRLPEATAHLEAALRALPQVGEVQYQPQTTHAYLGKAYLQQSRFAEAATHFEATVRAAPEQAEAHYLLALALACQGGIEPAAAHLSQAVNLQPSIDTSVVLHEVLGENYARAGRLTDAIRSAERALELARAAGKRDLEERVTGRLTGYRARQLAR